MLTKVKTVALDGMKGELVEIETDISKGLPYFNIIGMADTSVRESTERVKRALINSGFDYPKGKITVNLSPAHIHKKGSHYDLGIAIGLLLSQGIIKEEIGEKLFIGELSLDGKILPVKGVLPMIMSVIEKNQNDITEIILPKDNCDESYLFTKNTKVRLIPCRDLKEVFCHLTGDLAKNFESGDIPNGEIPQLDFLDIRGHENVKEALMIAVAGNHNLLMIGPPGTGKTMLAKAVVSILPSMSLSEQIETTKIYSYAGKLTPENPIIQTRPFRHVTQGTTLVGLVGGGGYPMPGEVSLAHNGVLFIDEMLEFPQKILEGLRIPIEDKEVRIVRKEHNAVFQSKFLLIGATNPCKCGFYGDSNRQCSCTQTEINRYRSKLSGALMDRIDMSIEVNSIEYKEIDNNISSKYSSDNMKAIVTSAIDIQKKRYKNMQFKTNGDMDARSVAKFCILDKESKDFLESVYRSGCVSMRRYHKILKLARTIGDIKGIEKLTIAELSSAFHFTRFLTEGGIR